MDETIEPIVYSKPPEMKKICLLYLDMLGYKHFIEIHKENALVLIDRCFQNAKIFMKKFNTLLDVEKVKFKGYSDNLILSVDLDGDKINELLILLILYSFLINQIK